MYMWGILRIKHGVLIYALGGGVELVPFTSIGKARDLEGMSMVLNELSTWCSCLLAN